MRLRKRSSLADRITILRDGEHVVTGPASAFDRERIIQAMVGRSLSTNSTADADREMRGAGGSACLSVENVSMGNAVSNTSFSVFAGQVTGIFGLVGAGRTEMMKIVAGVLKRDVFHGGEIRLNGKPVRYRVPEQAVADRVAYVTEDRKLDGFFETMSIAQNIYIGAPRQGPQSLRSATTWLRPARGPPNGSRACRSVRSP